MTTVKMTALAPAKRGNLSKIAAVATVVTALALAVAGAAALAANMLRDDDGYFNWPTETFTSGGYAIAMKTIDVSHAPKWALDAGVERVRVQASSDRPIFVGIARTADLDRYLRATEHDDVSGLSYHPFRVDYDHAAGGAPDGSPGSRSFWVTSAGGAGSVALDWKPRPGSWRAVVMNADDSRGVTADLKFGVRSGLLWWLGAGLLGAAVLAAAAAAALSTRARAPFLPAPPETA
jgi:hypothetical protein